MESRKDIVSIDPIFIIQDTSITYLLPPRKAHIHHLPVYYRGQQIDISDAESKAKRIIVPDRFNQVVSEQFLEYAMCMMLSAITNDDAKEAHEIEVENDYTELMLSHTVSLAQDEVKKYFRDRVRARFQESLEDTNEKHIKDAGTVGLSDITLEVLRDFRDHTGALDQEMLDLLMHLAWKSSAPTLARTLCRRGFRYE